MIFWCIAIVWSFNLCIYSLCSIYRREKKFYASMKKCRFRMDQVVFLGYVVSSEGVFMDKNKVKAIVD